MSGKRLSSTLSRIAIVVVLLTALAGCMGGATTEAATTTPTTVSGATEAADTTTTTTVVCSDGAEYEIEISHPETLSVDDTATITVTVTNVGDTSGTWEDAVFFKMGSVGWVEGPHGALKLDPGESKTWTTTAEATMGAGEYNFKLYGEDQHFTIQFTED